LFQSFAAAAALTGVESIVSVTGLLHNKLSGVTDIMFGGVNCNLPVMPQAMPQRKHVAIAIT
jgi:hypothetical protein